MPRKFPFTRQALESVVCPAGRSYASVYDSKTPGLMLMVTPAGARTYYRYHKVDGRPQRVRLGSYDEISIEQARKAAARLAGQLSQGVDPLQARKAARQKGVTLGELWQAYLDRYATPRKRSVKADVSRYQHLEGWARREVARITLGEVVKLRDRVAAQTTGTTANRVLSLLSAIFRRTREMELHTLLNPCQGVSRYRETSRERYLLPEELPRFFKALEQEPSQDLRDFFALCLWTGARSGNVKTMEWSEVQLKESTWAVSADKSKNGRAMLVHLPAPALQILQRRHKGHAQDRRGGEACRWVFPADTTSGHLSKLQEPWRRLTERAKLPGLRIHDLRRSLGSWQASSGSSLPVIGASLGHATAQATQVYARLMREPIRQSVDKAAEAIQTAAKGDEPPTPTPGDEAGMI